MLDLMDKILVLVLLSLLVACSESNENDFNCPEECGLYSAEDLVGPRLHDGCTAMEESEKCKKKFAPKTGKKKSKRKGKRKGTTRIVGGFPAKNPMPWMVRSCKKGYKLKT